MRSEAKDPVSLRNAAQAVGAGAAPGDRRAAGSAGIWLESVSSPVVWGLSRTKRGMAGGSPVAWGPSRTKRAAGSDKA
jgi:hypothetical protein